MLHCLFFFFFIFLHSSSSTPPTWALVLVCPSHSPYLSQFPSPAHSEYSIRCYSLQSCRPGESPSLSSSTPWSPLPAPPYPLVFFSPPPPRAASPLLAVSALPQRAVRRPAVSVSPQPRHREHPASRPSRWDLVSGGGCVPSAKVFESRCLVGRMNWKRFQRRSVSG